MNAVVAVEESPVIRLDIGCGKNKKLGFTGVDSQQFEGVDIVFDIREKAWPWETSSVTEIHCSHVLEHLSNLDGKWERITFFNEIWRILKPGAGCQLIFPHWASQRYYGDPTHKEVFSEFGFYYLDKNWRKVNAPHADSEFVPWGYSCDLECTWGYTEHPALTGRSPEYKQQAMTNWLEMRQDVVATVKARK